MQISTLLNKTAFYVTIIREVLLKIEILHTSGAQVGYGKSVKIVTCNFSTVQLASTSRSETMTPGSTAYPSRTKSDRVI